MWNKVRTEMCFIRVQIYRFFTDKDFSFKRASNYDERTKFISVNSHFGYFSRKTSWKCENYFIQVRQRKMDCKQLVKIHKQRWKGKRFWETRRMCRWNLQIKIWHRWIFPNDKLWNFISIHWGKLSEKMSLKFYSLFCLCLRFHSR